MGFLDNNKSETEARLLAEHPVKEMEKYLAPGAVCMLERTGISASLYLEEALYPELKEELQEEWGIQDRATARLVIRGLLYKNGSGGPKLLAPKLQQLKDRNSFSRRQRQEYRRFVKKATSIRLNRKERISSQEEDVFVRERQILAVEHLQAWSLERAAYLVRICCNLGFLSEAEAWDCLEKEIAPQAVWYYKDWLAYTLGFLTGCFLWQNDSRLSGYCNSAGLLLLENPKDPDKYPLWRCHPLQTLADREALPAAVRKTISDSRSLDLPRFL